MDLRIVNTCNNNCLYCLESELRKKDKFISLNTIFQQIKKNSVRDVISFYWWNPLLHPDLLEIIRFAKNEWYKSIWLLTNSYWLDDEKIFEYERAWLTTLGIYFNSFSEPNHSAVNWNWISYLTLLKNIDLVARSKILLKIIIHVNNLNIKTLYKDIITLHKRFWVTHIDLVNYFPFDKPYSNREKLQYFLPENKIPIYLLFKVLEKFNIKHRFMKFSKEFFLWLNHFYDFNVSVKSQIWEEDNVILSSESIPQCFIDKRCQFCFLKDICKFANDYTYEI